MLFSYLNPLLRHGLENLAQDAAKAGLAGVLVTDLPAESAQGFSQALATPRAGSGFAGRAHLDRAAHRADRAARHRISLRHLGHRSHRHAPAVQRRCRYLAAAHPARHSLAGRGRIRHQQCGAGARSMGAGRRRGDRGLGDCQKIEEFGAQAPAEVERFVRELLASQAVEA